MTFVVPYKSSTRTIHRKHIERTVHAENGVCVSQHQISSVVEHACSSIYCLSMDYIIITRLSGKVFTGPLLSNGYASQYFAIRVIHFIAAAVIMTCLLLSLPSFHSHTKDLIKSRIFFYFILMCFWNFGALKFQLIADETRCFWKLEIYKL
jgi:hypothetical protein